MDDVNSLSHSKWRCKYHIVFVPKYRRQLIFQSNSRKVPYYGSGEHQTGGAGHP